MSDQPLFDPEITALLDEIAADPSSNLIRPLRPREWRDVAGITKPISPRAPDLTRAERHLVQVYREEAARLLAQLGQRWLHFQSGMKHYLTSSITVDRGIEWPSLEEWRRDAARAASNPHIGLGDDHLKRLLSKDGDPLQCPLNVLEILSTANRLAPSPSISILIGLALAEREEWRSARACFESVMSRAPGELLASIARNNIAFVLFKTGHSHEALEEYEISSKSPGNRPNSIIDWFAMSCSLSKASSALSAARVLDDMISPEHAVVDQKIRNLRSTWRPDSNIKAFMNGIRERLGPASGRIANAVC